MNLSEFLKTIKTSEKNYINVRDSNPFQFFKLWKESYKPVRKKL